jgi:putative ABC transport system permease protein
MNLATARAAQRAKEVGVRKVVGAERGRLVIQFLGEALLVTTLAMMLALALVELLLPALSAFLQKDLAFDYLGNPWALTALLVLAAVVGLAAGSYPAFYLSAFEPARVLKGDVTRGAGAAVFRKSLVVLQFSISIALLIAAAVVYRQMQFARDIELGYDKEQIVVVSGSLQDGLGSQWEALKAEWLTHPDLLDATASMQVPGSRYGNFFQARVEGRDADQPPIPMLFVDYGFFETYGIATRAGRTFSQDFSDRPTGELDERPQPAYVLSELAARRYGWTPTEAVGKWIEAAGGPPQPRGTVIGVVADVHFESVHYPIEPAMYVLAPPRLFGRVTLTAASLRISGRNIDDTLAHIDRTWSQFIPNQPITRRFLDVDFEALYRSDQREGQILASFALLAVFIACLGLLGLASYTTERRTKEIGVRKVMGGTTWDIVRLLTAEFAKLVLLANVIAWPVAYFAMQGWLASFAYRVDIGLAVFAGSALLALGIAVITVGAVAARAASAKPIGALRYE